MSIQQTPVCQGTAGQPLAPKRRPKQIPIETKNEPHSATYPDVSLSPNKEGYNKTHLIIKLNKLSIQNKTRSVDDENDLRQGNDLSNKAGLKRSTSAKMRNQKFVQSDLLQSPTYEYSHNLANQNSAFRLKPSHNIHTRIPVGNHGNNKKARFQNISQESTESGISSNSQNSTTSIPGNQSDCDVPESSPTFDNEVPTLATGIEDRNLNMGGLEETIRANFEKREEPIYENLPFGYKVSKHRDQSDLHLQAEVFRLRDILNTMGGVESREQVYEELKSQKFKILELGMMNEKLKRDNEILKCKLRTTTTTTTLVPGGSFILLLFLFLFTADSHQKQQAIQTHIRRNIELKGHLNQLIGQNKELLFELRHLQSVKFPPNPSSQIPPKMPPMYTPPNEKLGAKQGQYAPIRNEHRTGSGEWHYIHKLTPLLSYNSIWKPLNRETDIPGQIFGNKFLSNSIIYIG